MQNVMRHQIFAPGVPDAQADAAIGVSDMAVDRSQAVMPGMPTPLFHTHLAGGQIQLIVENGDIAGLELGKAQRLPHGLPRKVHECLGLQQQHFGAAQPPLADLALEFGPPGAKPMIPGNAVECHEPDIVPVACIFRTWIAEANKDVHGLS